MKDDDCGNDDGRVVLIEAARGCCIVSVVNIPVFMNANVGRVSDWQVRIFEPTDRLTCIFRLVTRQRSSSPLATRQQQSTAATWDSNRMVAFGRANRATTDGQGRQRGRQTDRAGRRGRVVRPSGAMAARAPSARRRL